MTVFRPSPTSRAQRLATLANLARAESRAGPAIVVTTVNAALQRVPPRDWHRGGQLFCPRRRGYRSRSADRRSSPATAMSAPARCANRANSRCAAASSIFGRRASSSRCGSTFSAPISDAIRRFDAETQLSSDQIDEIELVAGQRNAARSGFHQPFPHRLCGGVRRRHRRRSALRSRQRRPQAAGHGALAAAVLSQARYAVRLSCRAPCSCSATRPKRPRRRASSWSPTITRRANSSVCSAMTPKRTSSRRRPTSR